MLSSSRGAPLSQESEPCDRGFLCLKQHLVRFLEIIPPFWDLLKTSKNNISNFIHNLTKTEILPWFDRNGIYMPFFCHRFRNFLFTVSPILRLQVACNPYDNYSGYQTAALPVQSQFVWNIFQTLRDKLATSRWSSHIHATRYDLITFLIITLNTEILVQTASKLVRTHLAISASRQI